MIKRALPDMPHAYREHIKHLVDWLLSEVCSAGGDGDAIWIVKNIPLEALRTLVVDECLSATDLRFWTVREIEEDEHGSRFSLSNNQESLVFTTTEKHVPPWSQCTITL